MSKLNIAVLYGGKSTEHEVSIISALQVMHNLDKTKYRLFPVYISKSGSWHFLENEVASDPKTYKDLEILTQNSPQAIIHCGSLYTSSNFFLGKSIMSHQAKIDVAFPVFHGTYGEDGTFQGRLEVANLPYVGSGVLASSLGMDKLLQKLVFAAVGLPQVKYNQTGAGLKYPLFVKPANGGSSIGISKVKNSQDLSDALEVAYCYDRRIVVEESAEGFMEINISVLGNSGGELKTSVCEQPVASKDILTYQDKYQSSPGTSKGMASAKRIIPAPIKPETAAKIAQMAKTAFTTLDCSGLARVDFLVSPDEKIIYINEINTIPGSLAFYLWEASGLKFPQLLEELIRLALEKYASLSKLVRTFSTNILANIGSTLKGGKLKS